MPDNAGKQFPLVSLLMGVKNGADTIRMAMEGLLSQDYPNIEIIVQDGASTDGTTEILRRYGDRIQLVSEPDIGIGQALRRAMKRMRGEIFMLCMDDEQLLPHAVSWGVRQMTDHPDAAIIYGDKYQTDARGNITDRQPGPEFDFTKMLCLEMSPPTAAMFLRTSCLRRIENRLSQPPSDSTDFELWLQLGLAGFAIRHMPGFVAKMADHPGSISCQAHTYPRIVASKKQLLDAVFDDPHTPGEIRRLRLRAYGGLCLWAAEALYNIDAYGFEKHLPRESTTPRAIDMAAEYFQEALKYQPSADFLQHVGLHLYRYGFNRCKEGDLNEGIRFMQMLPKAGLTYPDANYMCGVVLARLGRIDEARRYLKAELDVQPAHSAASQLLKQLDENPAPQDCPGNKQSCVETKEPQGKAIRHGGVEQLKKIEIAITDYCNLDCRLCSQATPYQKNKKMMSLDDLKRIGSLIRPHEFDYVKISGGEPTMHPQFDRICRVLPELFETSHFELATNGFALEKYLDCLDVFDIISLNLYPGRNDRIVERIRKIHLPNLIGDTKADYEGMVDVYAENNLDKTDIFEHCEYKNHLKIVQDRIYPCCVIFGQSIRQDIDPDEISVPLDENWRTNLAALDIERHCRRCFVDVDAPKKEHPARTPGQPAGRRRPVLSIVAATRNDDHGGNLLRRSQLFINGIVAQSHKYQLPVELILVEWNPPEDRPRLSEVLSRPGDDDYCSIRIIEVPAAVHNRYEHAAELPLYQMIAKNVGIRRAAGEFVLATNVDILFSDELFAFMASGEMRPDRMYRVNRYDVNLEQAGDLPHTDLLDYCRRNAFRVNRRNGTTNLLTGEYHIVYPEHGQLKRERLHTNASGDFQLMHRSRWFELRGYPEFDTYSFHLDSLMCYMAHFGGAGEEFLAEPSCIYHIEHKSGWTPEDEKGDGLWQRLERSGIRRITDQQLHIYADRMTREKQAIIFNDANWGHGGEVFAESTLTHRTSAPVSSTSRPQNPAVPEEPCRKYLSIVVTSRNDDHGGNTLHRTRAFARGLAEQCGRFNLDAELIIVEWNPPAGRRRLCEVLDWPEDLGELEVRFIEVPAEIHNSIGNSDKFPLFQMIAKNVGIRRARGEFVLATNIDILFSDELIEFLAQRRLDDECFYRIDRHDISAQQVPIASGVAGMLRFCRDNVIRIQGLYGTQTISQIGSDHFVYTADDTKLHENACGDFTLMSRRAWHRLRAYPELPLWSIYVDGLLLHMARADGMKQIILGEPMRIYHIEHETGWEVIPQTMKQRPSLDHDNDYVPWCRRMIRQRRPITNNNADWGYAGEEFAETRLSGRWKQGRRPDRSSDSDITGLFQGWIDTFAAAHNRLYYRDQSAGSLKRLYDLVKEFRPTKIVELGTLWGMSLRTWLAATDNAEITAIDLSFDPLHQSRRILPLDLDRVRLIEQDILKVDFGGLWNANDRVLLYIDAHDQPGVPVMSHVLTNVLPLLPESAIVGVDDLWYSAESLSREHVAALIDHVTLCGVDPLQCFDGYFAPYWKGGFWIGFAEVIPLMEWVNRNRIELVSGPRDKAVFFTPAARTDTGERDFDEQQYRRQAGSFHYNPVQQCRVLETGDMAAARQAEALCRRGAELFAENRFSAAAKCFAQALEKTPNITGPMYAQAICHAVMGDFQSAIAALDSIAGGSSHPRSRILRQDINRYIARRRPHARPLRRPVRRADVAIFTVPKAFTGHIGTIQRNAIKSWMMLDPRPEIILLGNEEGIAEVACELGVTHIADIEYNEFGTPLVSSILRAGRAASGAAVLAYVNCDIILMDDFLDSVNRIRRQGFDRFLMVGQRWDMDIGECIDFTDERWMERLLAAVRSQGRLQAPDGVDYFVYNRDMWEEIPPFALGRTVWDNWLVADAIRRGVAVIDATCTVVAIHQNHDYSHLPGGKSEVWQGTEAKRNLALAGGYGNITSIARADFVLTPEGVLPRAESNRRRGEKHVYQETMIQR